MVKNFTHFLLAGFLTAITVIAADAEQQGVRKRLPIGADLNLSNNVGAGTLFKDTYKQDPYVASTFYAYPYYKYGPFLGEREIRIQGEFSTVLEWMGEKNPFPGRFVDKFSLGDLKLRAEFKKALYSKDLGLSLTPALKLEAPLSKTSRTANRVLGLGGYLIGTWSKWGFSFTYKPLLLGYAHSSTYKSGECTGDNVDADKLDGGECKLAGRQTMMMLKNSLYAAYALGNHSLTLGFRTYHAFLRASSQGEKPEKEVGSDIRESSISFLEYAYEIPTSLPTTLTLGISGYQAPYDAKEKFRLPFFDFSEPAKNQTEAYVAINVTI